MGNVCQLRTLCRSPLRIPRILAAGAIFLAATCIPSYRPTARAQIILGNSTRFELTDAVQVSLADATAKAHLAHAEALAESKQWDDALESWMHVQREYADQLAAVTPHRFLNLRDYCHLRIAALPPEGLRAYRRRVDGPASRLLEAGLANRDAEALGRVVEEYFASSSGDDALDALAGLSVAQGEFALARAFWERTLPLSEWQLSALPDDKTGHSPTWLAYPDSDLDRATVRAKIVLTRILSGELAVAHRALSAFAEQFPEAQGRLAGRSGNLVELLSELCDAAAKWAPCRDATDWPTLGGSAERTRVAPQGIDIGARRWRQPLEKAPAADVGYQPRRVAEDKDELLSYHPLVVGNTVLVAGRDEIRAFDLATGAPAWGGDPTVFDGVLAAATDTRRNRSMVGAARFTMTADRGRLYARLGNPVTASQHWESFGDDAGGYLVCLDLASQGKLLWYSPQSFPLEPGWAFEGSPIGDGDRVYAALRRSDVSPLAYVACLDAQTGRPLWKRFVCGADTPSKGRADEATHNLLALHAKTLYFNTNLGAVAALDARDGRVLWLTCYPRATVGDLNALNTSARHFLRDLNPCIYWEGLVIVAPADSRSIFALDAATGMAVWETSLAEDAVHLLGVGGGNLIASGDRLWWIDAATGKMIADGWPAGASPRGYGRGALAGSLVYWPTRDKIHVFEQGTAAHVGEIELSTRDATGGNLVFAESSLVIAASDSLHVFGPYSSLGEMARRGGNLAPFPFGGSATAAARLVRPDALLARTR